MKFCKILSLTLMILAVVSCSTPKEISYFQDLQPGVTELTITDPVEIKVRPKDKLSILVNSQDQKLNELFNLQNTSGNTSGNRIEMGYTVDTQGFIHFPVWAR